MDLQLQWPWSVLMLVPPLHTDTAFPPQSTRLRPAMQMIALRSALVGGSIAMLLAAGWYGDPAPALKSDPELAQMLRGMALIKAAMVLAAIALLAWRFGHPIGRRQAAVYLAGAWLAAGATMLIWQLTHIPAAAVAFHLGEFGFLLMAWRDWQDSPASAQST